MNKAVAFELAYEYVRKHPNDPQVKELLNSSENGKLDDEHILEWWQQQSSTQALSSALHAA